MEGKYKAYPEYKASGVEWLERIPKHWSFKRIQETAILTNGFPFDSKKFHPDVGVPLVRIRDINALKTAVYFNGEIPQEAFIYNGDVLIGMDGDFNVAQWGGSQAALNQRVACVRCEDQLLQKFIFYLLPFNMKVVNDLAYFTTVKHLGSNDILKTSFGLPPKSELKTIVLFLDHETAKIDTLIEEQKTLIRLLQEKRQAVISHAVTKGLNPDVQLKDSSVEWLGQVPDHWIVTKAKHVASVFVPQRNKPELNLNGYGVAWATMEDMKTDRIAFTKSFVTEEAQAVAGSKILPKDSVIASCVGNFGVAAINEIDVIINQQLQAFIPNTIDAEYLREIVSCSKVYFELVGTAATLVYVNQQGFEELPVLLPPQAEQKQITAYVSSNKLRYDCLIGFAREQVNLLQERRTALISAAVTGKIDVRDWMPPLHSPKQHPNPVEATA